MVGNYAPMEPPKLLLDLFCGVGGASMGYHQHWPDCRIIGVDNTPQPNYPFDFILCDSFDFLRNFQNIYKTIDFIHASPPCKRWAARQINEEWPDLITPLRQVLYRTRNEKETLIPWVIENVAQAPIRRDLQLCGTALGRFNRLYELRRHRYFEFFPEPVYIESPECNHNYSRETVSVWGRSVKYNGYLEVAQELMEMGWAGWHEFRDSIPPCYTRWIAAALEREP
jgi:DNA (cytosine-5)-methyltransferase 1